MSEFNDFPNFETKHQPETQIVSDTSESAPLLHDFVQSEPAHESFIFSLPEPVAKRIPHIGHVALMLLNLVAGFFVASMLAVLIIYLKNPKHPDVQSVTTNIGYALGTQVVAYLLAFIGCFYVMPTLWDAPYFWVLSWRVSEVPRRIPLFVAAVLLCFMLASLESVLFPQPTDAPIDHIFKMQGAPWLLFLFGITVAPFFEEMAFRGFMLPAFATAYDWTRERMHHTAPRPLNADGTPQWSLTALIVSSLVTSILFALMHSPQNGGSFGSVALLVGVSMILCYVRLITRSLAASTFVHAAYNFTIFAIMILYTHGFQQMDKM
jgi:uncharacterized protein